VKCCDFTAYVYLCVGCYNGVVYVLERSTGAICWSFQTDSAVKSSACVNPHNGDVYIGSHDQHLYAFNMQVLIMRNSYKCSFCSFRELRSVYMLILIWFFKQLYNLFVCNLFPLLQMLSLGLFSCASFCIVLVF